MPSLNAQEGDQFWTMSTRIGKSGTVIAESPYSTRHIHIDLLSVKENELVDYPERPLKRGDPIRRAVYVKVKEIDAGTVYTEAPAREQWPSQCPLDMPGYDAPDLGNRVDLEEELEDLFQSNREEPIEWTGTEQNISEYDNISTEVFDEGDIRGDKNDLLDGHL